MYCSMPPGSPRRLIVFLLLQVFPQCYLWTGYPLSVAIDILWDRLRRQYLSYHALSPTVPFSPSSAYYTVSLISALERTLAFGFSGSPVLFIRRAMDRLGLSRGILDYGFPWLDSAIVERHLETNPHTREENYYISINHMFWPKDADGYVMQMSQRSIAAKYSAEFTVVCLSFSYECL